MFSINLPQAPIQQISHKEFLYTFRHTVILYYDKDVNKTLTQSRLDLN